MNIKSKCVGFGFVLAAAVGCACLLGCRDSVQPLVPSKEGDPGNAKAPSLDPKDLESLTAGNRALAFALYARLAPNSKTDLAFSPHSIAEILAIVACGARGD